MNMVIENVAQHLEKLGFRRDDSVSSKWAGEGDGNMTFVHFNGCTLAIDHNGQGWCTNGKVNLSPSFSERAMEVGS